MPSINFREGDFEAVSGAALDACARGDRETAERLDEIGRKMNAALAVAEGRKAYSGLAFARRSFSWRDVPSILPAP